MIEAAARLASSGEGWRMEQVARAAGISRATLYRLFPTREALAKKLAEEKGIVPEPDGTRGRILRAAIAVVEERGLDGATLDAVAAKAGLSAVTLYRHFNDRQSLISAALDSSLPRRAAQGLALAGRDPEKDLAAFATGALGFMRQHAAALRIVVGASGAQRKELRRLHQAPLSATSSLEAYLRRQMDEGRLPKQDARRLALAFNSMLLGFACLGPLVGESVEPAETLGPALAKLFLEGACAAGKRRSR
ncbi:MAG: TetR family transcriptional regulator [Myxococcales bacterium]